MNIDTEKEFYSFFSEKEGFVIAPFYPDKKIEEKIQEKLNVTVRAIPIDAPKEKRKCIFTNKETLKKQFLQKLIKRNVL